MTRNKGLTLLGMITIATAFGITSAIGNLIGRTQGYNEAMKDVRVKSVYPIDLRGNESGLVIEHYNTEPIILVKQPNDTYRRLDEVETEEKDRFNRELNEKYRSIESRVKGAE